MFPELYLRAIEQFERSRPTIPAALARLELSAMPTDIRFPEFLHRRTTSTKNN